MTAATLVRPGQMFLKPGQLANRWATTPGHLANLRSKGLPPIFVKLGTSVRYALADIEAYEDQHRVLPVL